MPWHMPADLQHFKKVTMAKPIIMGRKTFESIGRPLPGRQNIVISRDESLKFDGCDMASSIDEALALVAAVEEVMIIGGGFLYSQMINHADKLYLTFIELDVEGDTQFPDFSHLQLEETSRVQHRADDKNPYDYQFVDYRVIK